LSFKFPKTAKTDSYNGHGDDLVKSYIAEYSILTAATCETPLCATVDQIGLHRSFPLQATMHCNVQLVVDRYAPLYRRRQPKCVPRHIARCRYTINDITVEIYKVIIC